MNKQNMYNKKTRSNYLNKFIYKFNFLFIFDSNSVIQSESKFIIWSLFSSILSEIPHQNTKLFECDLPILIDQIRLFDHSLDLYIAVILALT